MDAVIEIDVVGQPVDLGPMDGRALREALAHGLQQRGVRPDLQMAGHAGLGRRDAGDRRSLDAGMAISAIEAETLYMMLMAEWNGLRDHDALPGDVRRQSERVAGCDERKWRDGDRHKDGAGDDLAPGRNNCATDCVPPSCPLRRTSAPVQSLREASAAPAVAHILRVDGRGRGGQALRM